jgi:hypothetical protein
MPRKARPRKRPCSSCPYRRGVPSGIWAPEEYEALRKYDLDTGAQAMAGAYGVLFCHQVNGAVCAGWAGCHDMDENLGIRLAHTRVDVVFLRSYTTDVPLFGSGAEAAEHGLRDVDHPSRAARQLKAKITEARALRGQPVKYRDE